MLPLAHVGHYLWILYLLPVIVVFLGILKSLLTERRRQEDPPP
jgi:cytochrome c-type biogenesis protein CcmH/NrfF